MMVPATTVSTLVTALVVTAMTGMTVATGVACTSPPGERLGTDRSGASEAAVGTIRSEPQTFNRLMARDNVSVMATRLTQAGLVRINRTEDVVEPWLAESWSSDDDGRTYTLTLRDGVTFSDGEPFSSADVVFSFEAVYDARVGSTLADSLLIDGLPIAVDAPDPTTVVVRFPVPYSPGLRLLDGLPMLPRHLLGPAIGEGTFRDTWGLSTPPADMAGLGPFVLESYQPGQRLVFARNTRYWRRDDAGVQLPYLDRITLEIVADQNAEMLRLETGEIDFISSGIRAEDVGSVSRAAEDGQVQLFHLGVGLDADFLAFNLQPAAMANDPRRAWLQSLEMRLAVSHAIDRDEFANTIYLGLAEPIFGPITPGNRTWFLPGLPTYEYDLRQVGIGVDVVPLEFGALIERIVSMDFDATYFGFRVSDTDPAANLDFWLSSAAFHLWNPSQASPATDWERRIDELIGQQLAVSDMDERLRLFAEVQTLFAEYQPLLYFAAPQLTVATSTRLTNVAPSLFEPYVLWNADTLAVRATQRTSP